MISDSLEKINIDALYLAFIGAFLSFQDLYAKFLDKVLPVLASLVPSPCCGQMPMRYSCYGTYTRTIFDLEPILDTNGMPLCDEKGNICFKPHEWNEKGQKVKIQRILCTDENGKHMHTHALLSLLIVPYSRYSVRFIIYHLYHLAHSEESAEAYAQKNGFSVKLLNKWVRDIENIVPILQQCKIMPETSDIHESGETLSAPVASEGNPSDTVPEPALIQEPVTTGGTSKRPEKSKEQTKQDRKKWISWIYKHLKDIWDGCLYYIHRTLFQGRRMPPNTTHFKEPTK